MPTPPLVPGPLYGLRTWTVVREGGRERLAGPHRGTPWPTEGAWLQATCARNPPHPAPGHGCVCGIHAWHPSRRSARRVLAGRRDIPGVVETRGAVEIHDEGLRAEEARPFALALVPGRNARLMSRLGAAYDAEVVEVRGPEALLSWCRERGLGLDAAVVAQLLGPRPAEDRRRARRARARYDALRLAGAVAVSVLLVVLGLEVLSDPPGDRVPFGRTGEVHTGSSR